jgi:exodeoxyribonuclease VIII
MKTHYDPSTLAEFKFEFVASEIIHGLEEAKYRKADGLNQSTLKKVLAVSPFHADYLLKNPDRTPAMAFGSALHTLVLEPEKFQDNYIVAPVCDRRTTEGKRVYAEFSQLIGDREPIKAEDYDDLMGMKASVGNLFESQHGKRHVESAFFSEILVTEGEFKGKRVRLKGKLDCYHEREDSVTIKDLKTVADISNINGASYHSNWAIQAGLYKDALEFALRKPAAFVYVCVGKDKPFDCRVAKCTQEMLAKGTLEYGKAIHMWLNWEAMGKPNTAKFLGIQDLNG